MRRHPRRWPPVAVAAVVLGWSTSFSSGRVLFVAAGVAALFLRPVSVDG